VALDLSAFRSALASLRKAVTRSQAEPADDEVRDSIIQRFEYTYELAWKMLKRYLAQEGVSEVTTFSQRDLYREAAARGLLEDPVVWFGYQKARTETSHTYNADKAREVHAPQGGLARARGTAPPLDHGRRHLLREGELADGPPGGAPWSARVEVDVDVAPTVTSLGRVPLRGAGQHKAPARSKAREIPGWSQRRGRSAHRRR
jgi:nucleotidyltransferase substrate binding protein (TIGR01987 family)